MLLLAKKITGTFGFQIKALETGYGNIVKLNNGPAAVTGDESCK